MMRPVFMIDAQVFQTDTWNRGMGKYTLSLLREATKRHGLGKECDFVLVTSSHLPDESERINTVKAFFERADVCSLPLLKPSEQRAQEALKINADLIDEYISKDYPNREIWYLIPTPLDTSIYCSFPQSATRKMMLFYDLIPLLFSNLYLADEVTRSAYFSRYRSVFEADLLFTISRTTLNDVEQYLCINTDRLCNIDGAPIPRSAGEKEPNIVGLGKFPFILMPSGDDMRKNNFRAVKAFESFNALHQNKYKLVITSRFGSTAQNQLKKISSNIIFSGNVSEQELCWLYYKAELVLFVPEYEGLGLPVLEAVERSKSIVCSDIPVFKEISDDAFFYADPHDVNSISNALNDALDENRVSQKKMDYNRILNKYSWSESSRRFVERLNERFTKETQKSDLLKIAVLGPDPTGLSTIGKVMQEQHASLSKLADITYYVEQSPTAPHKKIAYLPYIAKTFSIEDFNIDVYKTYDAIVYHIGSSDYHIQIIKHALSLPGIAVIHDPDMHGIMSYLYTRGMISETRYNTEKRLHELMPNSPKLKFVTSLANSQIGLVIHSEYALQATKNSLFIENIRVRKLNLPTPILSQQPASSKMDRKPRIGIAGILHNVKGIGVLANILDSATFDDCLFHVFGYDFVAANSQLSSIRNHDNVTVEVNLTDLAFQQRLSKLDILLNYRPSYNGETSIATLEALRYGVVPIVRDIGWFAEIPDTVAVKVMDPEDVPKALRDLVEQPQKLRDMSKAAIEFVANRHLLATYSQGLIQFVKESLNGDTPALNVMRSVKQTKRTLLTVDMLTNPYK
jgi:glycosyltransferase involved in cell wall biosynthesis